MSANTTAAAPRAAPGSVTCQLPARRARTSTILARIIRAVSGAPALAASSRAKALSCCRLRLSILFMVPPDAAEPDGLAARPARSSLLSVTGDVTSDGGSGADLALHVVAVLVAEVVVTPAHDERRCRLAAEQLAQRGPQAGVRGLVRQQGRRVRRGTGLDVILDGALHRARAGERLAGRRVGKPLERAGHVDGHLVIGTVGLVADRDHGELLGQVVDRPGR